jgi:mannan endo-1,6-alpha-mannosidase
MPNNDNVISEVTCEPVGTCNIDQRSFKAYLARWMAMAAVKAPFTYDQLKPILEDSATAAVSTCTGGSDGNQCGLRWTLGHFDDSTGVGEQMSALEIIQANLINYVKGPVTADTGGTSKGDPNAGQGSRVGPGDLNRSTVTTGDRVGAGFLTVLVVIFVAGGAWWLVA